VAVWVFSTTMTESSGCTDVWEIIIRLQSYSIIERSRPLEELRQDPPTNVHFALRGGPFGIRNTFNGSAGGIAAILCGALRLGEYLR